MSSKRPRRASRSPIGMALLKSILPCMAALVLLAGCASRSQEQVDAVDSGETGSTGAVAPKVMPPNETSPQIEIPEVARQPAPPVEYPPTPFTKEVLYELLVAEIAGYRGQFDEALNRYWALTQSTRDPGIAGRTVRLAAYLKNDEITLKAALIWAEVEPDDIDAHRYAANQLVRAGDYDKAVGHMFEVKRLGGFANFEQVAYRAEGLDPESREALLKTISEMVNRNPDDRQLLFSKAVLLEQEERFEEARAITEKLMVGEYDVNVTILHIDTLRKLGEIRPARSLMKRSVNAHADDRRLRTYYARWLFEENDLSGANQQYRELLERAPQDSDVLFALALIAMEQDREKDAGEYLDQMVRLGRRSGEAHYYLGALAEKKNDVEGALREYRQVGTGYEFVPAQGRIVDLMAGEGQLAAARTYLDRLRAEVPDLRNQLTLVEAQLLADHADTASVFAFLDGIIASDPDNVDLLYFRAMTGEKAGDLALLERDLRRVLELDPNNADALNALGYTLADKTDRHQEAYDLIRRALAIKPNEPAFIDSMGWVQFRMRNYDEALANLRRALALYPNDEIAAHLGEVLWVVGKTDEARKVWAEGFKLAPDSEILKAVTQRLQK